MTVPLAVVMVFVFVLSMPVARVSAMITATMFVVRDVFVVVPIIADEVDRTSAGMVFPTMLAPMLLMSGRNVQVNRLG